MTVPGANVFFTDQDLTSPELPDGSHLITCKQVTPLHLLYDAAKAGRYLARLALELPIP